MRSPEQNFLPAEELGIEEVDKTALIRVLFALENGEITQDEFDMSRVWAKRQCKSVGCLFGWAREYEPKCFDKAGYGFAPHYPSDDKGIPPTLRQLFKMNEAPILIPRSTPAQAAQVLREYLLTGKETWDEVLNGA